jgi:hypothetical protein
MIRLWNYNKNRIHSYRGARYLEMYLEDQHTKSGGTPSTSVIFRGEIRRAPGGVFESYEDCCECILFTTNPVVLSLIEKYDPLETAASAAALTSAGDGGKLAQPLPSFLQSSPVGNSRLRTLEPSSNYLSPSCSGSPSRGFKFSPSLLLSPSPSYHHIAHASSSASSAAPQAELKVGQQQQEQLLDEFSGWDPGNIDRPSTGKRNPAKRSALLSASESVLESQQLHGSGEHEADPADYLTVPSSSRRAAFPSSLGDEDVLSLSFDSLPAHLTGRDFSKTVSFQSPLHRGPSGPSSSSSSTTGNSSAAKANAPFVRPSTALASRQREPTRASVIVINILSNWGDCTRVGLSGISALDANFSEISLPVPLLLFSAPNGLSKLYSAPSGCESQLNNLITGCHLTTDPGAMWSIPYGPGSPQNGYGVISLRFELPQPLLLRGLRIWNYNGDNEDTWVGVRHVDIYLEQKPTGTGGGGAGVMYDGVSPTATLVASRLVLRKAPGEEELEYAQFIHLNGQDKGQGNGQGQSQSGTGSLRYQRNNSTSDLSREFGEDTSPSPTPNTSKSGLRSSPLTLPRHRERDIGKERQKPLVSTDDETDAEEMPLYQPLSPDSAAVTESGTCLVNQQYETPVLSSSSSALSLSLSSSSSS